MKNSLKCLGLILFTLTGCNADRSFIIEVAGFVHAEDGKYLSGASGELCYQAANHNTTPAPECIPVSTDAHGEFATQIFIQGTDEFWEGRDDVLSVATYVQYEGHRYSGRIIQQVLPPNDQNATGVGSVVVDFTLPGSR